MNIVPKAGPTVLTPVTSSQGRPAGMDAKAKAIAAFNGPAAPQSANAPNAPVQNPNQVSPEELGALRTKSASSAGQNDISDSIHPGVPSEAATDPKETPISSQYAILAKKEKALRMKAHQQEQNYRAREQAILAKEEAAKSQNTQDLSRYISKDRFQNDPLGALADAGLTYDQITQLALNGNQAQDPRYLQLAEQVKALKEEQVSARKAYDDQQLESRAQAIRQMERQAKDLITNDPAFETIKEYGATKHVIKLIERTFDEDGILLTVEEAALKVEEHLMEKAIRLSRLNKVQQRLKPAASKSATQQQTVPQQQGMKTLTNAVGSTKPLSTRERAILAAKGQLHK